MNIDTREPAVEIEKLVKTYVGNETKEMAKRYGVALANELEFTVACMFMGRVIAQQHIFTGEKLESLFSRSIEATNHHASVMISKQIKNFKGE